MKYRAGIFEFFGYLSFPPLFVFYKLRRVLLPEFGDLILRIWHQKMAQLKAGSAREKRRSLNSLRLSEVPGGIGSSADPGVVEKSGAAERKHGHASCQGVEGGFVERPCALTALRQIFQ
jgi:hypothetical protein